METVSEKTGTFSAQVEERAGVEPVLPAAAAAAGTVSGGGGDVAVGPPGWWRVLLAGGVTAAFVAAGVLVMKHLEATAPKQETQRVVEHRLQVRVRTLRRREVRETVKGYGTVRSFREADIVSEVAGRVVFLHPDFEVGSRVKKGTVLVRLDTEPYRLALERAQSLVREAQVELERQVVERRNLEVLLKTGRERATVAEREYRRVVEEAREGGAVADTVVDAKRLAFLREKNTVEEEECRMRLLPAQEARLRSLLKTRRVEEATAARNLRLTEISAPFSGEVVSRNVQVNAQITPSSLSRPLGRITALGTVEIAVEVPAAAAAGIRPGAPACVRCEALRDGDRPCRISRQAPLVNERTRTACFFILVNNADRRPALLPGMFVKVLLAGRVYKNVLSVPRTALFGGAVFIADKENRVRRRVIRTEQLTPELLRVVSGVREGERLILNNLDELVEGMLVLPEEKTDKTAAAAKP